MTSSSQAITTAARNKDDAASIRPLRAAAEIAERGIPTVDRPRGGSRLSEGSNHIPNLVSSTIGESSDH